MLNLINVLFAVAKGKNDYDALVYETLLNIKEIIEVLDGWPQYFEYDWQTELIRKSPNYKSIFNGYALRRRWDGKALEVYTVEQIHDRPFG